MLAFQCAGEVGSGVALGAGTRDGPVPLGLTGHGGTEEYRMDTALVEPAEARTVMVSPSLARAPP